MKSFCSAFVFFLLLVLAGCSTTNKTNAAPALKFGWTAPEKFQVIETIRKDDNIFVVAHDCKLIKANGQFELQWIDAKILEVNGEKLADSEELQSAMKPLQSSFIYPPFRVSQSGEFLETTDPDEYTKRSDEMLDAVVTNRTEENRKYFANFAKSQTGKQVLNQFSESIWQTWVGAWTGVVLTNGESRTVDGTADFFGVQTPVTEKIANLGSTNSGTSIVNLRYEQDFTGTNFSSGFNGFIDKMAKEMEIKNDAGPITNQFTIQRLTILKVQTERQTLKPHWAKRITKTIISAPQEKPETELEIHEYNFKWSNTNETQKQP
jgi:hypothetical protein